ncbi:hypothetical protein JX265_011603 [Neoarthrinium moseri]|uniref:ABC transporter domain-containing protein n=1 Tax=Neoarthrinium moseri TaxID=1658444 RepID=A0A9Q0AJE7_9PEZI|nr:hypothetical protein JX265_011603 [Neoarthrinium moseri]
MIGSLQSAYPLDQVDDVDLKRLCEALWGWELCASCKGGQSCSGAKCAWERAPVFASYFAFYKDVTSAYVPELLYGDQPALRSHQDVADIIRLIKDRPDELRAQLTHQYFSQRPSKSPSSTDQHRAFNIVVKIMTMVNCSAEQQPSGILDLGTELGTQLIPWHNDASFSSFVSRAFPKGDVGALNILDHAGKSRDIQSSITARRLEKIARLTFRGTEDLRNHLRLDSKNGVVEIYHYTSVLKEHLAIANSSSKNNIPAQVALEALHSLQMILFPFGTDSELKLRRLVAKQSLDPDCVNYDFVAYDEDFPYRHFGTRLMELYDEVESPSPRGIMEKWFERKSGARGLNPHEGGGHTSDLVLYLKHTSNPAIMDLHDLNVSYKRDTADIAFGPQKDDVFDFTLLFEQGILGILPSALFILVSIARTISLWQRETCVRAGRLLWAKLAAVTTLICFRIALVALWALAGTSGFISIDGLDLAWVPSAVPRTHLTALPQDSVTPPGSVRTNLDPLETVVGDEVLIDALSRVGVWETISSRGGLDVGFESLGLSHGQQQLFCLARALLSKNPVVLLDEATSSVDHHSDEQAQRVLREAFKEKTVLVVAHRLETICDLDLVVVMEKGRIVEMGDPRELKRKPHSLFRTLWESRHG